MKLEIEIKKLKSETEKEDLWTNVDQAQKIFKKKKKLEDLLGQFNELCKEFNYKILNFKKFNLRKHGNKYIQGGLYILEF